jgi:uncharacterized protein YidB (DUF937 family)
VEIPDDLIQDLIPAVKEQLNSKDLPFVAATFTRLTEKEGLDQEAALELIAQALAITVNTMMTQGRSFDTASYRQLLKLLPALPDESGEN